MNMKARKTRIIEMLSEQGEISIQTLSQMLGVSEMTIHRDLDALEAKNRLKKKRGGAIYVDDRPAGAMGIYQREKAAIAYEAAKLIEPGDTLLFDNSTTALEVARCVKNHFALTVYATNLDVANELRYSPNIVLYCSGGFYLPSSTGFVGSITEAFVERLHVSKCIVGTSGVSLQYGITCPYPLHAALQRKIMAAADRVIMVTDYTKFGKVAIEKICDISEVDDLVTDDRADPALIRQYEAHTRVTVARVNSEGEAVQ